MKNKEIINNIIQLLKKGYTEKEIKNILLKEYSEKETEEILDIVRLKIELSPPSNIEKISWDKREIDTRNLKEATAIYIGVNHAFYNIKKIAIIIFFFLIVFEIFSYTFYSVLIKNHYNYFYYLFSYTVRPLILISIFVIAILSMQKNIPLSIDKLSKRYITNSSKKIVISSIFSFSFLSLILFGIVGIYGIIGLMNSPRINFSSPEEVPLSTFFHYNFYQFSVLSIVSLIIFVFLFSYKTFSLKEYFQINSSFFNHPKISLKSYFWIPQIIIGIIIGLIFLPFSFYLFSLFQFNKIFVLILLLLQIIIPVIIFILTKKSFPYFSKSFFITVLIPLGIWFIIIIISIIKGILLIQ